MTTDKKHMGLIAFLLLLIIIIGFLSYENARDYSQLKVFFELEKRDLENELNRIIVNYDNVIDDKRELASRFKKERNKILQLRDTIRNLKQKNYYLIKNYRNRIADLEEQNKVLFLTVDSLSVVTSELKEENELVKEALDKKSSLSSDLARANRFLKRKVARAGVIKISPISIITMKKRNSGRYTTTSRSSRTDAFKISFDLLRNDLASVGDKTIYIQIINEDKNVISARGNVRLRNGSRFVYSDYMKANYQQVGTRIISLIKVDRNQINKGSYFINVYVEGVYAGSEKIRLR